MKFKELTKKDIQYAEKIYWDKGISWDERINILKEYFGKSERATRKWLVKMGIKEKHQQEDPSPQFEIAKERELSKDKKRFIITWAQNNTPVHKSFLKNIEAYAKFIDAEILVIAGRYKNPTSVFTDKKFDVWEESIVPYLDAKRHDIHKYLSILSDIKIQPTANSPMSGMEGVTGENSCVIGHPRVHMQVIGALEGHKPKVMFTTGSITTKNYTDSKAGKKGEFHHTLGFVVVEIKNSERFFLRQVTALNSGEFTDLYYNVKNENVSVVNEIECAVLGDIHIGNEDDSVILATKKLLDRLKPKKTIIHDLMDFESISHHDAKDPIKMYEKYKNGKNSLIKEIDKMYEWLDDMKKYNLVIVRSNHDDFVDRWIKNEDWKKNIENAYEYSKYLTILLSGKAQKGLVPYLINKKYDDIITLGRLDSLKIKGIEVGVHGDYGSNGTRASATQFRKLNTKICVGHSHTPHRIDGFLQVGCSCKLRMGYNLGISSWMHSHVIIDKNGKMQHINILDGEFTTL